MALTHKQELFKLNFLACRNATQAALAAGYSAKTAYSIGSELLKHPAIQAAIAEHTAIVAMSADEVLLRLSQEARGDIGDFWDIPEAGIPTLNLGGERAKGKSHLIKRMKVKTSTRTIPAKDGDPIELTTTEIDFELYDAQAAKRLLGQHHGLFIDRDKDGQPLPLAQVNVTQDFSRLTLEELRELRTLTAKAMSDGVVEA